MQGSALHWIKASSSGKDDACVELAADGDLVAVRDSKNPHIVIHFNRAVFAEFLYAVRRGEFDRLPEPGPA